MGSRGIIVVVAGVRPSPHRDVDHMPKVHPTGMHAGDLRRSFPDPDRLS
jgi:hypothetical protein